MVHLLHRLYGVDAPAWVDQSKTVEVRITYTVFSQYASHFPLVFAG